MVLLGFPERGLLARLAVDHLGTERLGRIDTLEDFHLGHLEEKCYEELSHGDWIPLEKLGVLI